MVPRKLKLQHQISGIEQAFLISGVEQLNSKYTIEF